MKNPHPATILALHLANAMLKKGEVHGVYPLAMTATRICAIATQVRRLVEHSCNVELTSRQASRLASLRKRANDLLKPYNMTMDNPWGLCHYACPLKCNQDYLSESDCIFLA